MDAIPSLKKRKATDSQPQNTLTFINELTEARKKKINEKFDKIKREQDELARLGELYLARYQTYYNCLCDKIVKALDRGDKMVEISIWQEAEPDINRIRSRALDDFLRDLTTKGYTYVYRTERDCDLETFTFLDIKLDG
jgi:hypothetical protein